MASAQAPSPSIFSILFGIGKSLMRVVVAYVVVIAALVAVHFPYHTDPVTPPVAPANAEAFYAKIYAEATPTSEKSDGDYVKVAESAIDHENVVPRVTKFVSDYHLENAHVLDVGAGTGYLQDQVKDYVGLDISSTARRYFHKPFVQGSATELPFRDGEFDALWSIWVLEHVPHPEQGLAEMRRVTKDGGLMFLQPAWNCASWYANGYEVRPYSDFGIKGKLIKASLLLRASPYYRASFLLPTRFLRWESSRMMNGPTRYHYSLLEPNWSKYWVVDSDAINALDYVETMVWFTSRGDECLNCGSNPVLNSDELIIRVHKKPASSVAAR
jgi:ubiquinone/menaquinone biosynthesis C-methylase UbiE